MERLRNYADQRNAGFCVHCGGPAETRDHAPSRAFLDLPYPENLPFLACCERCNRSFSSDEEYVAAFIECVVSGSTDPARVKRGKIRGALSRNRRLRERIERRKKQSRTHGGGDLIVWEPEDGPFRRVILKLARCHAAYELNEPRLDDPASVWFTPLLALSEEQRDHFEGADDQGSLAGWPEVGSRAMQRLFVLGDEAHSEGWVIVQECRYRYMALAAGEIIIRGVLSDYLAFEVAWE